MSRLHPTGLPRRHLLWLMPAFASGCATPLPLPATLDLRIIAGADQNPDASGHATPVAIRVYQLADANAFERADVFALTEREAATLGAAGLGMTEIVVAPGEQHTVASDLKPGTAVIGIAVLFRDIDHAVWRVDAAAAPHGPVRLTLRTAGLTASLRAN
jgi:type VI secretion system protein VasD